MSHRPAFTVAGGRGLITTAAAVLFAILVATAPAAPADPVGRAPEASPEAQAERIQVGAEAPDFDLESLDGQSYRLSSLRGEKNAVIILFRGAW